MERTARSIQDSHTSLSVFHALSDAEMQDDWDDKSESRKKQQAKLRVQPEPRPPSFLEQQDRLDLLLLVLAVLAVEKEHNESQPSDRELIQVK